MRCMAYVDGVWLDRAARQQRIDELNEENELLRQLIERGLATDYDLDRLEANLALLEKLERVHRAEYDMLYFMIEYFSEDRNPGNDGNLIPAGVTYENSAEFHKTLCSLLDAIVQGKQKTHVAWACPRGHAKTGYLSNGFLCHQVVFRHRKYIVEISETTDVAGDFIQWTANQLKFNEKLIKDFGQLLHKKKSMNEVDNKYEFVTLSGTKVEAKGVATQMRGLRHGNTRPDLFILDDLESKANTNTPELIEKNKQWFREEMLPALARHGIAIYMGTILCFDSLLDYVLKERRDFESRVFPAILSWAEREDLWQQWREIYRSDDPDAAQKARQFYEENEAEMLRGARTLWPQMFSYYDLMVLREENGAKAFAQEYLNSPVDEERQIFKPEYFTFYEDWELEGKRFDYIAAVDFGMGKQRGDYSALITLARNKDTGICYVVDCYLERVHPDVFLRVIVDKTLHYQYSVLAVEAIMAQEWFADKLGEELQRHGYPASTRLKKVKNRTAKQLRIEALLPDIQNGKIRFSRKHRLLLEMFEMYPMHKHDDGPDALASAYMAAKTKSSVITTSAKRLR
jgi:predicted phage terminase large subunit-like protein